MYLCALCGLRSLPTLALVERRRVPETMRVPHTSRTLRCVGFVTTRPYSGYVWSARKDVEKLRYMHRNPVKRGLVELPEQWKWSSFRAYRYGETRPVPVKFQEWALEIRRRPVESFAAVESPLIRKVRE